MTQQFAIEVSETRVVTTSHIVEASSREEAERRFLAGEIVASGVPQGADTAMEHSIVETVPLPEKGASLIRLRNALRKPHAFTIHARIWGDEGLGGEEEYRIFTVEPYGRNPGVELEDFHFNDDTSKGRRFVPATHLFAVRIDSESDDISYAVTNIEYDTDGGTAILDLPKELEIDVAPEIQGDDLSDAIGDAIAEQTGWCVKGFNFEVAA